MSITLQHITEDNFEQCLSLEVDDSQKAFVARNVRSLAEAWLFPGVARPFAVYDGEVMVGFMMLNIDCDGDGSHDICDLWRLMIDSRYQGKGYGKASMHAAVDYLRENFNPKIFRTSIVPGNEPAENLYKNVGFIPTGEIDDGEIVMELRLRA